MNCKKHPDEPAVSIYSGCGCGLCAECDKEARNTLCKSCRKDKKIDGIVSSAIYLALFGVAFFIGYKLNFFPADRHGESNWFFCGYLFGSWLAGWQLFNSLTMNTIFIVNTETAWITMILNLILYLVVGFFIAPIVILWNTIKIVYNVISYRNIK